MKKVQPFAFALIADIVLAFLYTLFSGGVGFDTSRSAFTTRSGVSIQDLVLAFIGSAIVFGVPLFIWAWYANKRIRQEGKMASAPPGANTSISNAFQRFTKQDIPSLTKHNDGRGLARIVLQGKTKEIREQAANALGKTTDSDAIWIILKGIEEKQALKDSVMARGLIESLVAWQNSKPYLLEVWEDERLRMLMPTHRIDPSTRLRAGIESSNIPIYDADTRVNLALTQYLSLLSRVEEGLVSVGSAALSIIYDILTTDRFWPGKWHARETAAKAVLRIKDGETRIRCLIAALIVPDPTHEAEKELVRLGKPVIELLRSEGLTNRDKVVASVSMKITECVKRLRQVGREFRVELNCLPR